jgi:hypothetical protein
MNLSAELRFLTLTALFTGVLWVPIILNRLGEMGLWKALKNPEPDARPHAAWAWRLANAHRNAIENLVVFAPLALAASPLPSTCTAGVPLLRTIAFVIGFGVQVQFALRLLG